MPPVTPNGMSFFDSMQSQQQSRMSPRDLTSSVFSKKQAPMAITNRPKPKFNFCKPEEEPNHGSGFTAKPADDIPRNKLTEKLTRGLQFFVQRMQKREGFRCEVQESPLQFDYVPQPRECATLTSHGNNVYLVGGNGSETISEISCGKFDFDKLVWSKVNWTH